MEGQGVHIICEYSTSLRPPTLACCKLTSEHTCEPTVSGSAHVTGSKFSSRTETVIDDITYAVLTLHSPTLPAEGSYANMQPRESSDQPHPQTEDVEYSSIVF
ncbi:UNVERIFIED_CONTAM: hypothetical protein FKN15_045073 [Acipenser sinensis]